MQTARQHFEKFPEPYRSQEIENTSEEVLEYEYETAEEALRFSFVWLNSPQELWYWSKFDDTLC